MRRLALLALCAGLCACGFHLAGNRPLPEPLKLVRIDVVAPYQVSEPPVEASLRERLRRRGARITEKLGEGATVIRLSELKETRKVLSVGADGKAQELQLILRVSFDVRSPTQIWLPPDVIEVRRDYSFNAQQVLAKEQEADRLQDFMQDEMAELLLLRIEAAANQPAPPATPITPPASAPATPPATAPTATPATPATPEAVVPTAPQDAAPKDAAKEPAAPPLPSPGPPSE